MKSVFITLLLLASQTAGAVDFNRDIRPILSNKCFACHGFDEHERKADLRLDTREGAFQDLGGYAAIVPGDLENSEAWYRIVTDDEDDLMPPPKFHKPLTDGEKDLIRQWIEAGAEYRTHWSYAPLIRDEEIKAESSLIDHFVRAGLEKANLDPVGPADRVTLARRLYFDLLGLPAPVESIEAFRADESPDAYEKLVDRLLADKAFGERLAVYWLDLVRYADSIGYHSDNPMEVSAYRDYVISAFNRNLPYDRFTIEQLAGDLLPDATLEQKIASGYNRLLQTTQEGGAQANEYKAIYAADRVRNASTVWLGSTIGCAQCHDHKFDPFTARDFYAFAAFFADITEKAVGKRVANLKLPTEGEQAEIDRLKSEVKATEIGQVLARDAALSQAVEEGAAQWEVAMREQAKQALLAIERSAKPTAFTSTGGQKFKLLEDRSLLAEGGNPDQADYKVTLKEEGTFKAVRLEVKMHESFPKGLSRGNGNFVLTHFRVKKGGQILPIETAKATFEQNGWPVAGAIDPSEVTGWAVSGQTEEAANQEAIFVLREPVTLAAGEELTVEMQHRSKHGRHNIGRFRLGLTDDTAPNPPAGAEGLTPELLSLLGKEPKERTAEESKKLRDHYLATTPLLAPARAAHEKVVASLAKLEAGLRTMLIAESMDEPRMTRLLHRGDWMDTTGEVVEPALPAFLPKDSDLPADRRGTRLDLANWIVGDSNPLTARAFVNRVWMLFFGEGISRNVEDLGGQGEPPTHPELLDQLAIQFREDGWDVKRLIKGMLMSETYRRSSVVSPELLEKDPLNELYGRQGRWRISAEFVRDTALTLGGLLEDEVGGVSVKPYQPAGYWQHLNFPKREWKHDTGGKLYRRGLYTFWSRSFLHPAMMAFDAPSREECTSRRSRSNIPQQALVMLNDPAFVEAARKFGERIAAVEGNEEEKISMGMKLATGRTATADEIGALRSVYEWQRAEYTKNPGAALEFLSVGEAPAAETTEVAEAAAWAQVGRTILNAYETTARN
ncbi:PSD1 and planctomycete cytochrome C domain-containing protein [bacterium]|nr:PSD1 and planctomycete cytochrome C domain-containing protein [bacterium]